MSMNKESTSMKRERVVLVVLVW